MLLRLWIQKVQSTMLWRTMMHIQKAQISIPLQHILYWRQYNNSDEWIFKYDCMCFFFVCTFVVTLILFFPYLFILLYSFNTLLVFIGIPHLYHSSKSIFSHHHVISDVHFLLRNNNFCVLYKSNRNKTSANNFVALNITFYFCFPPDQNLSHYKLVTQIFAKSSY